MACRVRHSLLDPLSDGTAPITSPLPVLPHPSHYLSVVPPLTRALHNLQPHLLQGAPAKGTWKKKAKEARVRREYRTADQVLADAAERPLAAQPILDMRGPQARVVTNLQHLNQESTTAEGEQRGRGARVLGRGGGGLTWGPRACPRPATALCLVVARDAHIHLLRCSGLAGPLLRGAGC